MKSIVLLIAVYALIINQVNKDFHSIPASSPNQVILSIPQQSNMILNNASPHAEFSKYPVDQNIFPSHHLPKRQTTLRRYRQVSEDGNLLNSSMLIR